jgi:hypothetical protein
VRSLHPHAMYGRFTQKYIWEGFKGSTGSRSRHATFGGTTSLPDRSGGRDHTEGQRAARGADALAAHSAVVEEAAQGAAGNNGVLHGTAARPARLPAGPARRLMRALLDPFVSHDKHDVLA